MNDLLQILGVTFRGECPGVSVSHDMIVRLRYDDPATYASRAQRDQSAVEALVGWRVVSADVDTVTILGVSVERSPVVVSLRMEPAPIKSSATDNKTNKSR